MLGFNFVTNLPSALGDPGQVCTKTHPLKEEDVVCQGGVTPALESESMGNKPQLCDLLEPEVGLLGPLRNSRKGLWAEGNIAERAWSQNTPDRGGGRHSRVTRAVCGLRRGT